MRYDNIPSSEKPFPAEASAGNSSGFWRCPSEEEEEEEEEESHYSQGIMNRWHGNEFHKNKFHV